MFEQCDCGSGKPYLSCCGKLHSGAPAESAEALMRSRYSAYCRGNVSYLLKSWAAETRPVSIALDTSQQWTGLKIRKHKETGTDTAVVQFEATFLALGGHGKLSETSRFRREGEGWVYIDGDVR